MGVVVRFVVPGDVLRFREKRTRTVRLINGEPGQPEQNFFFD